MNGPLPSAESWMNWHSVLCRLMHFILVSCLMFHAAINLFWMELNWIVCHMISTLLQMYLVPGNYHRPLSFPHAHGHTTTILLHLPEVSQCWGHHRERTSISSCYDMQPKPISVRTSVCFMFKSILCKVSIKMCGSLLPLQQNHKNSINEMYEWLCVHVNWLSLSQWCFIDH